MVATHTVQNPWQKIRSEVSAVDSLMGDADKAWKDRDTAMGCYVPMGANGLVVGLMGDDVNKDCTMTIWVYCEYGPAEWVIGATWTIGAQQVVEDPTEPSRPASALLYADTIVTVDQGWPKKLLNFMDHEGDDGVAKIIFEATGAKWIKVEISGLDAGLKVTPIFRHW